MARPVFYERNKTLYGNFKHYEVMKSSTAISNRIDNTPTPLVLIRSKRLAEMVLQPVRDNFGIPYSPKSWYRCEQLERKINGGYFKLVWCPKYGLEPNEDTWKAYFERKSHPMGEAADIKLKGIPTKVLYDWIKANLKYDQLIMEFSNSDDPYAGWVHVSLRLENRMQNFKIGGK